LSRPRDGNPVGWAGAQAAMLGIGVLTVFPIYFIAITAFKTRKEYLTNQFLPPSNPTLANFHTAFRDGQILRWVGNSVLITVTSVLIAAIISALAAYPLARGRFPGRLPFIGLNIVLMVVPPVVLVVPLFLFFVNLGLVNSRIAVVIIYVGLLIPFSIYLLVNFFATIPRSLEEAARIDGAGPWRILYFVVAPNLRRVMELVLVTSTVTAFAYMFTYIYVITNGGPGFDTNVAEFQIYYQWFTNGNAGYACAMATVLLVITSAIGAFQIRILARRGG
jgi:ABC-type glycerol-3-phosphate transport system permease component